MKLSSVTINNAVIFNSTCYAISSMVNNFEHYFSISMVVSLIFITSISGSSEIFSSIFMRVVMSSSVCSLVISEINY